MIRQLVSTLALSSLLAACGSDTALPQVAQASDSGAHVGDDAGARAPDAAPCIGSPTSCGAQQPVSDAGAPSLDSGEGPRDTGRDEPDTDQEEGLGWFAGVAYFSHSWMEVETDYEGEDDTTLYSATCEPIAQVPASYAEVLCETLRGRLAEGISVDSVSVGTCSCPTSCPGPGNERRCWTTLQGDRDLYPWVGAFEDRPLTPLRSLGSMNPNFAVGTRIYVQKWDGVVVPTIGDIAGFVHDGCFVVDYWEGDEDLSIDVFYGSRRMSDYFKDYLGTDLSGDIYLDTPKCQ